MSTKTIEPFAFPDTHPFFPNGGRPTWELALFFPSQGSWTQEDYLKLETWFGDNVGAELINGILEVLPVPTEEHQDIGGYLYEILKAWVKRHALGKVSYAGLHVQLKNGTNPKFRMPDVCFMKAENAHRRHHAYWEGADLMMEVVSGDPKDHERDYKDKVADYAEARVSEYWIIDPFLRQIRVLVLDGDNYRLHGDFGPGMTATSVLLPGFAVSVDAALAGGE